MVKWALEWNVSNTLQSLPSNLTWLISGISASIHVLLVLVTMHISLMRIHVKFYVNAARVRIHSEKILCNFAAFRFNCLLSRLKIGNYFMHVVSFSRLSNPNKENGWFFTVIFMIWHLINDFTNASISDCANIAVMAQ